jgi:hypothetical protein
VGAVLASARFEDIAFCAQSVSVGAIVVLWTYSAIFCEFVTMVAFCLCFTPCIERPAKRAAKKGDHKLFDLEKELEMEMFIDHLLIEMA